MLKMVIFDFDGVIVDSESAHFNTFRESLQAEGIELTWEVYCEKYLGYTDQECIVEVMKDFGREINQDRLVTLLEDKKARFARFIECNSLLMAGVRELLEDLRENGIVCAICSGALREEIVYMLDKERLGDYFMLIVAADDVERGKPDPQGYRLSLAQYNERSDNNIRPEECAVIEDSVWGFQAAHGAGMRTLAVATSYPAKMLAEADRVEQDLTSVTTKTLQAILD